MLNLSPTAAVTPVVTRLITRPRPAAVRYSARTTCSSLPLAIAGPPLPGELGGPVLRASGNAPLSADHPIAGAGAAGQRDTIDIARSPVLFRTSSTEKPDATAASPAPAATTAPNAATGPFRPLSGTPAPAVTQPNDPTAAQNYQDQKEAFITNIGEAAARNTGNVQSAASP